MYLGKYAAHKQVNCGVGIITSRDEETITVKFENGVVGIAPPKLIVELTSVEVSGVRLDSNNIRLTNEKLMKMRSAEEMAKRMNDFRSLVILGNDIKRLKRIVSKDYNCLKETFGIDYEIVH